MKTVAASEFDLLSIARALVGEATTVEWLLSRERKMPKRLSPQALELIKDILSKGMILKLSRLGWRVSRSLTSGGIATGRLWERHSHLELQYSDFSLRLLVWLTQEDLRRPAALGIAPTTIGDELLCLFAFDLAREVGCGLSLAKDRSFRKSLLCWLVHVDLLAVKEPPKSLDVSALMSGQGAIALEALAPTLAKRWVTMERSKARIESLQEMTELGMAQRVVLENFTKAVEEAERPDLAFFLLQAAAEVASSKANAAHYTKHLETSGKISERSDALMAAAAFLDGLAPMQAWVQHNRSLRFFDDEYETAQLLLQEWDALGDLGYGQLQSLAGDLRSFTMLENNKS